MANAETLESTEITMRELVNKHIVPNLQWYENHYRLPRFFFRLSGLVVVIGSLLLPIISSANYEHNKTLTLVVSLTVAVFSSLATFYRWDEAWHSRIKAQMDLQSLLAQWELDLAAAKVKQDAQNEVIAATQRLFIAANQIVGMETEVFFKDVKGPNPSAGRN